MELNDIIMDSLTFPLNNIQSLVIYLVLGFILAIVAILTGVSAVFAGANSDAGLVALIIGLVLCVLITFVIDGYVLDIVKSGINRNNNGPSIDPIRQLIVGVKLFIVQIVYLIIPILITIVLGLIFRSWIVSIIALILFIIFGLALTMGECRLAKTEDLGYALNITEAIEDIKRIGIVKVALTVIAVAIISFVILFVLDVIFGIISQDLASIVTSIVSIYLLFFGNRATGLLYSDL